MEGSSVFLLNPLTKALIILPDFSSTDQHATFKIGSAYISSDPVADDCLIVCVVKLRDANNAYSHKLLSCEPGYNSWTLIDIDQLEELLRASFCFVWEFAYIKGSLRLTDCCGDIIVCNVGTPPQKATNCAPHFFNLLKFFRTPSDDFMLFGYRYTSDDSPVFHVLKVNSDQSGLRWTHVEDIGDAVLLMAYNHCTCVRARDYPLLKRNHVYIVGIDQLGFLNDRGIFERLKNKSLSARQLAIGFPQSIQGNLV